MRRAPVNTPFQVLQRLLLALLFCLFAATVSAEEIAPDKLLADSTHQLISALQTHRAEIQQNPERLHRIIEEIVMPHMDFIVASRWVLGKHWRRADKQQKLRFIREFRNLLLRFYSTALSEYLASNEIKHDIITFLPLRESTDKDDLTVRAEVNPPNGEKVPVHYRMHRTKKGWKVLDVSVAGISVIQTYRTSFASEIRQKGLDGLIAALAERNDNLLNATQKLNPLKKQASVFR